MVLYGAQMLAAVVAVNEASKCAHSNKTYSKRKIFVGIWRKNVYNEHVYAGKGLL